MGAGGPGICGPLPAARSLGQGRDCERVLPAATAVAAAAAIREVRDGFLLPAQRGRRSEAGSTPVFSLHTSALVAAGSLGGSP